MTGDRARVSVAVAVDPARAFAIFTQEIDQWWRHGARFRNAGARRGIVGIEPGVGGRLFESIEGDAASHVVELGRVQVWDPPRRVAFSWRASNFAPHESTHVDVEFTPQRSGTLVTVTHSGFAMLRDDHPVRRRYFYAALARVLNAPEPRFIAPPPDQPAPPHEKGNRRISNRRLKECVGVSLRYPDYDQGLRASV